MANFSSNHGQILLALEKLVKDLQPENLSGEEVRIRGSWIGPGGPYRGVSITENGEQEDDGTIGTQDIGYVCSIVFAEFDDEDAILSGDQMIQWRELVRRRLTDQRLPVTITNLSSPSEHVCTIIKSGQDLTNKKKYPNYSIRRILVAVWLRELATT
jgi:hypothetical protein